MRLNGHWHKAIKKGEGGGGGEDGGEGGGESQKKSGGYRLPIIPFSF